MTIKIFTSYTLFLLMAFAIVGTSTALASEVTGTLSSDTSVNSNPSGNISGTVSSASSGGSSSGGSRSSGGSSSLNTPDGVVLGASTDTLTTPGFPNAGFAPEDVQPTPTPWSMMISFIWNIMS